MNQNQIEKEVIRYLRDVNYRYAILIDGEWGCGKTYFVLNDLKKIIEEYEKSSLRRSLRYISLYGCKSVQEVEESICWSILDEKFYEKYDKIAQENLLYGEKKKKIKQRGKIACNVSKKIISLVMQKFGISGKAYEYIADFFALDKNIFIFDDLERCNCSINDILGYINGLVEHEGVKVILIANEKEIGTLAQIENKELQYMVSAKDEIKIPQEESVFSYRKNISKPELDIEELERRRKKLFSAIEYDQQYVKIREKLIGITISFEADFSAVMHKLINNCENNHDLKEVLNDSVQYFVNVMKEDKHQNLRTFQFFLSKIEYLYTEFELLDVCLQYKSSVLKFLVENCFMLCVEFKGNVLEPEEHFLRICFQNKRRLKSVDSYVRYSIFTKTEFDLEICNYISIEIADKLPSDDPYSQLYNEYYIQTQDWVEQKLGQVLNKLQKNGYSLNLYQKMLLLLIRLRKYGFDEKYLNNAVELMIENIHKGDVPLNIIDDCIPSDDGEEIAKCREIISKLNKEIRASKEEYRQKEMQQIIESGEGWAKQLDSYLNGKRNDMPFDALIISKVDKDIWVKRILESSAADIHCFRECLQSIYPSNVVKRNIKEDMIVIEGIIEELKAHNEPDLIKKNQLEWLIKQLSEIHERHFQVG